MIRGVPLSLAGSPVQAYCRSFVAGWVPGKPFQTIDSNRIYVMIMNIFLNFFSKLPRQA